MDNIDLVRKIDVLIFDGVNMLDIAGPVQAFEAAKINGRKKYKIRFISTHRDTVRACCGLQLTADNKIPTNANDDDLLIPGGDGVDDLIANATVQNLIQKRFKGDGRIISICSGALVLASAGILDGLKATTHWSRLADTQNYPEVDWDLDRISISQENIFTSAGVTTGIDLALSLIQKDCGPSAALDVARELVVQLRRTGGQSQYAFHLAGQFAKGGILATLIEKIVTQPHLDWPLEAMAETAGMNARTLSRHFKRNTQHTPAQFVEKVRTDHARSLMLDNIPLKQVATNSGFGDIQRMRRAFQRQFGVLLSEYQNKFT